MEDIDDLLDEIERDLTTSEKHVAKSERKNMPSKRAVSERNHESGDCEIDDVLGAIDNDEFLTTKIPTKLEEHKSLGSGDSPPNVSKCFPLYLGGSDVLRGINDSGQKMICNKLRCTSCDFKVVSFRDFTWNQSVDYLFFRNTMPDEFKLRSKLRKSKGTVAYCCQCSWKSVTETSAISKYRDLRWVCGRH